MSDPSPYQLPEFILDELKNDRSLTERDMEDFDKIYQQAGQFNYPDARTEANWVLLRKKMQEAEHQPELQIIRNNRSSVYIKWAVAAMLVLTLSIGLFQFFNTAD